MAECPEAEGQLQGWPLGGCRGGEQPQGCLWVVGKVGSAAEPVFSRAAFVVWYLWSGPCLCLASQ